MKNIMKNKPNKMWGGHFEKPPAEIMEEINASIDFDKILYLEDITGSKAHCGMLIQQKIISEQEGQGILKGLDIILTEIEAGDFEFKKSLEDIHMNIEARLTDLIGDIAGKLHTARSRNDQVALDFKMWVRARLHELDEALKNLQIAFINKAEENTETIMSGFTHLQTAQPVTLGYHLMAYVEMFGRDRTRVQDLIKRMNECPLGSAALAGTSYPIDRFRTATELGFSCPTFNAMDSVSDRDFAIEFLSVASICAMHLSRFAEEIVVWSSKGFNFIKLSDSFTSGSSIMPQKRNPDAAELVRAKTGRIYGSLMTLLTVMKGLPLAYSKDMQEDKEPVFDSANTILICVKAMTGMVDDIVVNKEAMREASQQGYSTATDIADWLVQNLGLPFRKCHHITGNIVKIAEAKECRLDELSLAEMQSIESGITDDIFNVLSVENSVKSRNSFGGTAPEAVREQIKLARERFL